ncbi:MAG: hypothetical protein IKH14_08870 [Prevotella sp.]|nr:hypothetical protein [Prevotella sp.]
MEKQRGKYGFLKKGRGIMGLFLKKGRGIMGLFLKKGRGMISISFIEKW